MNARPSHTRASEPDGAGDGSRAHRDDAVLLWSFVDELTAGLSEGECRAVYSALASGIADGWRPTRTEVADLVAFARQQATAAQDNPLINQISRHSGTGRRR